ncbi:MAG: hypothetical protein NTZ44_02620 [Candidatus Nomurabacteria bacterium]|nr:hypothetical protein [Candidatus Nomurabacteria bacterium]
MNFEIQKNNSNQEKEKVVSVHQEHIGILNYKFEVGEKELEKWNTQVEAIHTAIEEKDFESLKKLLENQKLIERTQKTLQRSEFLSLEKQKHIKDLLAISVWVIDNQNKWPGNFKTQFRLVVGGLKHLEDFTKKDGRVGPNCLDMCAITQALANKRGILGQIERVGVKGTGSRFGHRYWRSKEGFVVDTLWGIDIGGVYLTDEEYEKRRIRRQKERLGGLFIGSFNPSSPEDCTENYLDKDETFRKSAS